MFQGEIVEDVGNHVGIERVNDHGPGGRVERNDAHPGPPQVDPIEDRTEHGLGPFSTANVPLRAAVRELHARRNIQCDHQVMERPGLLPLGLVRLPRGGVDFEEDQQAPGQPPGCRRAEQARGREPPQRARVRTERQVRHPAAPPPVQALGQSGRRQDGRRNPPGHHGV